MRCRVFTTGTHGTTIRINKMAKPSCQCGIIYNSVAWRWVCGLCSAEAFVAEAGNAHSKVMAGELVPTQKNSFKQNIPD